MTSLRPVLSPARAFLAGFLLVLAVGAPVAAQESKSTAVAKELTQLLDQAKLDSIAAKDSSAPEAFVAALYFPGSQLLVVSAKYSVPMYLNEKLSKKDYREIYIDLNSASVPESKVFIEDGGANGLRPKKDEGQASDAFDSGGKHIPFDGDWRKQKLSQEDYMKAFAAADDAYAKMLTTLVEQLKKK